MCSAPPIILTERVFPMLPVHVMSYRRQLPSATVSYRHVHSGGDTLADVRYAARPVVLPHYGGAWWSRQALLPAVPVPLSRHGGVWQPLSVAALPPCAWMLHTLAVFSLAVLILRRRHSAVASRSVMMTSACVGMWLRLAILCFIISPAEAVGDQDDTMRRRASRLVRAAACTAMGALATAVADTAARQLGVSGVSASTADLAAVHAAEQHTQRARLAAARRRAVAMNALCRAAGRLREDRAVTHIARAWRARSASHRAVACNAATRIAIAWRARAILGSAVCATDQRAQDAIARIARAWREHGCYAGLLAVTMEDRRHAAVRLQSAVRGLLVRGISVPTTRHPLTAEPEPSPPPPLAPSLARPTVSMHGTPKVWRAATL